MDQELNSEAIKILDENRTELIYNSRRMEMIFLNRPKLRNYKFDNLDNLLKNL